uniref:Uncharacterized protein n=1 Tax=Physcomitrium patens TaxID=3218 RepID=A9T3V1_PHYPA|nr:hypothetical protein PHYPA_005605 [Physcomitrium patens]
MFEVQEIVVDNRDVVPFYLKLSQKYNGHISIEICASICAIKYIHKYIHKDRYHITIQFKNQQDEIK